MTRKTMHTGLKLTTATAILLFLSSLSPAAENNLLPDGQEFKSWEVPVQYSRTYHVAQQAPGASDENPGTADKPWKTIGKAAETLQPGERVIVHKGTYREAVHPARGGTAPDKMVSYEAAEGEEVIVTGADECRTGWAPATHMGKLTPLSNYVYTARPIPGVYVKRLDGRMFQDANVFNWRYRAPGPKEEWLTLGQVLLDCKPLRQVAANEELADQSGVFFVEDDGMAIHVRLPDGQSPEGKAIELVTRPELFAPRSNLNFIRVAGFRFRYACPPYVAPHRGAISSAGGHHWIIEDCEVGYVTSIGINLGVRWFNYEMDNVMGFDVVRRCYIHHCGFPGILAVHFYPNEHMLIEDNLLTDIGDGIGRNGGGSGDIMAAMKLHFTVNSLIRRNVILRTQGGPGIWLDWTILNTRVTQNLIHDVKKTNYGAIFVEIAPGPNLVDNNLIMNASLYGSYEHDSARNLLLCNLLSTGGGPGVRYWSPGRDRNYPTLTDQHYYPIGFNRVYGNIISEFEMYVQLESDTDRSDWNVLASEGIQGTPFAFGEKGEIKMERAAWLSIGNETHSVETPFTFMFDPDKLELSARGRPGQKLPTFPPLPSLLDRIPGYGEILPTYFGGVRASHQGTNVASAAALLATDLVGNPRDPNLLVPGPLLNLPLDGTPVKVDPRKPSPRGLFKL